MPLRADHLPATPRSLAETVQRLRRDVQELRAARSMDHSAIGGTSFTAQSDGSVLVGGSLTITGNVTVDGVLTGGAFLDWINVLELPYGAHGDGVHDDTAAIQAALNAAAFGGTVYLPPGTYVTSAPLMIPPQVRLLGSAATHLDTTTCCIKPSASFSGAAVLLLVDQATGGYSVASTDSHIENLTLEGSNLTGTSIDGIQAQGYVHGLTIDCVQIRHMPNHGLATVSNGSGVPYSWRGTRIVVNTCSGYGLSLSMTDSTWIDVEAIGNGKSGWFLGPCANAHFIGCRAEWNAFDGFTISGTFSSGNGSGGMAFTSCSTDRNNFHGFNINATGPSPIIFRGLMLRRDGRSSTSAGYAGFCVNSGSTVPVLVDATCFPGTDDNGGGNASPQYAFSIVGSSSNVVLGGGFWQGISAGVHDDGSNSNWFRSPNVFEATGATSAQTFAAAYNWATTGQGTISQSSDAVALQLTNSVANTNNALLNYVSGGSTGLAVKSKANGDAATRFQRDMAGFHQWGDGTNAKDTNLYRSAAGVLTTDQSFSVGGHALGISRPGEHGAVAWTDRSTVVSGGTTMTIGTVYLSAVYVNRSTTVTKLFWGTTTAGATPTSGQNFIGLYNSAGTLLTSVGVDARVTVANGFFTETISQAVTPGLYWVAWVFNATTTPSVLRGPNINASLLNFNLAASSYAFATNATTQTSLPSTITPGSNVASSISFWAAIA